MEEKLRFNEVWFNGNIKDDEKCPTISQFLKFIEDMNSSDEDKKLFATYHLTGTAKEIMQPHLNQNWAALKNLLLYNFKCKLSLKDKIDLRRYLIQHENESCKQFHSRCEKWQLLLCDDQIESVFERDILINFVSGLKEEIYQKLVHDSNISDLETCVKLAIEIEQVIFQSEYIDEEDVKVEVDIKDIKTEVTSNDEDVGYDNPYEYLQNNIKVEQEDYEFEPTTDNFKPVIVENPNRAHSYNPCDFCSKTFASKLKLQKHLVSVHNQKINIKSTIKCPFCDEVFIKKSGYLKSHIDNKHPDKKDSIPEFQPLYCDICPDEKFKFNFNREGNDGDLSLALHKAVVHCEKDPNHSKQLLCQICHKSFRKTALEIHIKVDHFNKNVPTCGQCGRSFDSLHKLNQHSEGIRCKGSCDKCDMTFDDHRKLNKHKLEVHEEYKITPSFYPCEKCGATLKSKTNLKKHLLTHNEKNVICDICGRGFKDEIFLKDHKDVHLPKTIKCIFDNCECMFSSKARLSNHLSVMHKKSRMAKNFKCEECPKSFNQNCKLQNHIKAVHLGERNFKCDQCDFDAAYKNTLIEHVATVHEGVMYECEIPGCGKQMNRKANINKHMKTAHGIPLPHERIMPKKRKYIDEK